MKVLKSWLNDFAEINISNDQLARLFTSLGTEVDDLVVSFDESVIVAEILEVKPHPNADRLRLATVNTGTEKLEIVCGAPNIEPGQKVPLAQVGAKLGTHVLQKTTIRGVESNGMLCAEDELGLGSDHSGILILDPSYELGKPLSHYINSDAVYDLEITPNRGDLLSHFGVAREIAAALDQPLKPVTVDQTIFGKTPQNESLKVFVEDQDGCPQYNALMINGVTVAESPEWLQARLQKVGLRPINNVVDATNYVLMELGQPLHAFDAGKVLDSEIIVRRAGDGEIITTLDGQNRALDETMLVITDKNGPIAIAGIIGGADSEVTGNTHNIILESAVFDSTDIRRTSKKLGLSTDASYRFERGIDAGMTERAIERAAQLIIEIAGGKIVSEVIRVGNARTETTLSTEYNKINQLTGLSLTKDEINQILERLGFSINQEQCQIPSWRHDIGIWQDLSEEVARIIGYDRIPKHALPESEAPERSTFHKKEMIKDYLVTLGFSEVYNYPFLSEKELRIGHFEPSSLLEVSNPAQSENKYLRSTLVPGLLKSISKNPVFDPVLIFEIGNTFSINAENTMLGIAASGKNAKKIIHQAVSMLTDLCEQSEKVIAVQEIAGEELAKHKIRKPAVYIIETNLSTLLSSIDTHSIKLKNETHKVHYRPVSPYPVVSRDIAFIIDSSVSTELVANTIYNTSEYIILAELFDEFVSDKFGNNKKSLAYHLYLQHPSRTLTDIEAENVLSNLVSKLANKYQIKIRD